MQQNTIYKKSCILNLIKVNFFFHFKYIYLQCPCVLQFVKNLLNHFSFYNKIVLCTALIIHKIQMHFIEIVKSVIYDACYKKMKGQTYNLIGSE